MSDSPDPRPRPQFGEYATPQEQRDSIADPDPDHWTSAFAKPEPVTEVAPNAPVAPTAQSQRPVPDVAAPRPDRFITFALLGLGLVNVMLSIGSFLDFSEAAQRTMAIMDIPGTFTNTAQAQVIGWIAAAVLAIAWLAALWLSVRQMRRGRLSWWVPVVAAVVAYAIVTALISIVLINDPAIHDALINTGI